MRFKDNLQTLAKLINAGFNNPKARSGNRKCRSTRSKPTSRRRRRRSRPSNAGEDSLPEATSRRGRRCAGPGFEPPARPSLNSATRSRTPSSETCRAIYSTALKKNRLRDAMTATSVTRQILKATISNFWTSRSIREMAIPLKIFYFFARITWKIARNGHSTNF